MSIIQTLSDVWTWLHSGIDRVTEANAANFKEENAYRLLVHEELSEQHV